MILGRIQITLALFCQDQSVIYLQEIVVILVAGLEKRLAHRSLQTCRQPRREAKISMCLLEKLQVQIEVPDEPRQTQGQVILPVIRGSGLLGDGILLRP
jgi:hypothetical protein